MEFLQPTRTKVLSVFTLFTTHYVPKFREHSLCFTECRISLLYNSSGGDLLRMILSGGGSAGVSTSLV